MNIKTQLNYTLFEPVGSIIQEIQVISKERVTEYGEVYTAKREVNAMLDLVKQETERIDSRFLEPACGTGNFLAEVLSRKLWVVETRYRKSQLEYEWNSIRAVSSVYGIDIILQNVVECRIRLLDIFNDRYDSLYKGKVKKELKKVVKYILDKNILHGNARTLKKEDKELILFSEWSFVNARDVKRIDYTFKELNSPTIPYHSDLGVKGFTPNKEKEFPPVHFLRIADVQ